MEEPRCPTCHSKSVKKSTAIYEQGQSSFTGNTGGFGISSSGSIGAFQAKSSGTRITKIAEKNAPLTPDANKQGVWLFFGFIIFLFLGAVTNGFVGIIVAGLIGVVAMPIVAVLLAFQKPSDEQIKASEKYEKQWYCSKCGSHFE